jgi:uncharacterized protein/predicted aspartyl protease
MRRFRFNGFFVIALLPALYSSQVGAQSFNCRYAKTPAEVLICQDGQLAALDERMAGIYSKIHGELPDAQRLLIEGEQRNWLHSRMECGRDRDCIERVYQGRIQELTPTSLSCTVADPTGTPLNVRATPAGQLLPNVLYNGTLVAMYKISGDGRGKSWALVGKPGGSPYGWVFLDYIKCRSENPQEANKSLQPSPTTSVDQPQLAERPTSNGSTAVPMRMEGGTYVVPVLINDAITLEFVVDSGAADVSIPADVVMTLMRTGTLRESDFLGEKTYVLADGSKVPSQTFRIRSLKVGGKVLEDVNGSVASVNGSLLLGQSFLGRFKTWSVDNMKHALVFE